MTAVDIPAAFFFDAEDDDLGGYYGPPITNAFFRALLTSGDVDSCCFRIYAGDLLLDTLTRRIAEVQFGGPPNFMKSGTAFRTSSSSWLDNRPARAALAADLAGSLSEGWHLWTGDQTYYYLAAPRTHVLYVEALDLQIVASIAKLLADRRWFIGAAEIDLGNPIQTSLIPGLLVYRGYYRDRCLWFVQPMGDPDERWDVSGEVAIDGFECQWHEGMTEDSEPTLLVRSGRDSPRGALSRELLQAVLTPTHHERVLSALARASFRDHDRLVVLSTERLEPLERVVVPREKLVDYALSKTHETGRHKARLFEDVLGIESDDWQYLADQLRAGLHQVPPSQVRDESAWGTEHHIQYRADMPIVGRNGAVEVVRTVWKIVDSGPPTLVTLYLQGEKGVW
jgi:hypothetical protein